MKDNFDLAKWLAGEMTGSELEAFEKSPEFTTYKKIKDFSGEMQAPVFDTEKSYQSTIQKTKDKPVVKLKTNWILKIAAILVLGLGITFLLKNNNTTTQYAKAGEKTTFYLPDNSEIVMNSESEIKYKKWNWDNNRNLNLKGEAFFKVAKGKKFDVNTELGKVTVIGTQFNVKSRNKNFEVECYEGKVKVTFNGKNIFLEKGDNIIVQNGKEVESRQLNTEKPSWLLGEMKFSNTSLDEIISEIENQYAVEIKYPKAALKRNFTGILPLDNLDMAMKILCKTYNLDYKKASDKKIILTIK